MDQPGVELVNYKEGEGPLPLIVRPKNVESSSLEYMKDWISDNQSSVHDYLLKYGAILFKRFAIEEGIHFQEAVQCYERELSNEYRGASPRKLISGTQLVFSASELPSFFPIPQHLEMSFLPAPPRLLFFCCLEAPTSLGGETSLCDFKDKFESKGVTCIRNYAPVKPMLTIEPMQFKGWEAVFDTKEKEVVERELKKSKMDFKWNQNDELTITNTAAAIEEHPLTGDKIWFNHLATFHWSLAHQEFHYIYKRLGKLYYLFLAILAWILHNILVIIKGPMKMAFHMTFGDGTEIPIADISHIRDTIHKNMVFNRWEKGDLLMIDKFRISHGRQPYSGKERLLWLGLVLNSNLVFKVKDVIKKYYIYI